jgi:NADH-quinone oxidoreductase subunit L
MEQFIREYVWLIPFLPLLGFLLNGLPTALSFKLPKAYVHVVACGAMLLAFFMAVGLFCTLSSLPEASRSITHELWPWIHLGFMKVNIAFLLDPLSSVMIMIITGIGFLIHVYSIGYMQEEPSFARFFTYLNLFCFMMLILVMGDNLFLLFVGWEGVGLCSYLLIGFWFKEKANGAAGMKAFIVNRIGDFGLMIGLMMLYWTLQEAGQATLVFTELKTAVASLGGMQIWGFSAATVICVFLFVGATGKSAQIPLYVWLPDAMAGPTPVSALIHAATMVTAGVYMIARMNWLFVMSPVAMTIIATIGAFTALFGAAIGFAQTDIKKVLAYSTVSQLGYMFLALGSGAFSAGVFHLMTHAFFKACLFLGSGSVILGMHHEQDMRLMGGLRKYMPITFITFMAATIAISGIVPFSGFFSKDEILWQAFSQGSSYGWYYFLWVIGLLAAIGTAFYMMRCVTVTFFGELRANDKETQKIVHGEHGADDGHDDHHGHGELVPHESPKTMTFALVVLAVLAVLGGFLNVPYAINAIFGSHSSGLLNEWLSPVIPLASHHEVHAIEYILMILSIAIAGGGMYLGFKAYTTHFHVIRNFVKRFPQLYNLVYNKFFVDEFYFASFVKGVLKLNKICAGFDRIVVDGAVNLLGKATLFYSFVVAWVDRFFVDGTVNFSGWFANFCGGKLRKLQTGNIQQYAFGAVLGVVVVLIIKVML